MSDKTQLIVKLYNEDALEALKKMPSNYVQTCVTSPPYWGLRDYGAEGQLGQEDHPDEFVEKLVEIFREIKRVLTDNGTIWINIGDTYVGTGHKGEWKDPKNSKGRNGQSIALNNKVEGLKSKDMIGIPWKLAFALQKDGWYLRSDIIWEKPNAMPSPVADRPVSSYEHIFLLSKSKKYFYDFEALAEKTVDGSSMRRNRDVWRINTKPFKGAHFAVYPAELVEKCILAGSQKGDYVMDPFSGSGTTGIVALNNERNYVGIEVNPEYLEMSKVRLKTEVAKEFKVEEK
jgi:site-specific DNA-methyltransferase (cytosine-N4-specific)